MTISDYQMFEALVADRERTYTPCYEHSVDEFCDRCLIDLAYV